MRYLGWMVLLLAVVEIISIVMMADWIGGAATLLLMLLSFAGGLLMLRHFGLSGVMLAGSTLRSGQNISLYQLLWPVRYTVAALLLMSPGFASDVVALALLLPLKGKPLAADGQNGFYRSGTQDDIIEGEYTVTHGQNPRPHADNKTNRHLPHDV